MAASATFLTLSSLTPKTLSFSNPKFGLFSLNPSSIGFRSNPISISALVLRSDRVSPAFFSRFVRNVAVSSDFDQEEDVLDVDGDDSSYAPDLQLFVGNLPFTIDSAQLAGLFESAGQVERVEVFFSISILFLSCFVGEVRIYVAVPVIKFLCSLERPSICFALIF